MMHEKIKEEIDNGNLKFFMKHGAMHPNILFYYDVFNKVESLKSSGMGVRQAVIQVSISCNVSYTTIYKAIKLMRAT